ncbi:hypothetical protein [Marinobacter salsuginis]|jgi:hypothetical protein|uniref:Rap1a immunity protein domain-containing protein n=1 Tax=Marinobacter salsuginis TaxID=418719 RepID=A0A5M3Q213_9GAMM|nr:hypothetical protein [Marinobacter salsuginis]GBO89223.1 hypothetical protein MSSD14B_28910 [Marinobacter salsuginis]
MSRPFIFALTWLALIGASSPALAISVQDYFSIQEQASVQNVEQRQARNALNGVHAGLYDAFAAMLLAGDGKIYTANGPLICVEPGTQFRIQTIRDLIGQAVGTFERPALSAQALEEFPLGVHLLKELANKHPCTRSDRQENKR